MTKPDWAEPRDSGAKLAGSPQPVESYLLNWFHASEGLLARRGSDAYRVPSLAELVYMDEKVLTPLVRFVRRWSR